MKFYSYIVIVSGRGREGGGGGIAMETFKKSFLDFLVVIPMYEVNLKCDFPSPMNIINANNPLSEKLINYSRKKIGWNICKFLGGNGQNGFKICLLNSSIHPSIHPPCWPLNPLTTSVNMSKFLSCSSKI